MASLEVGQVLELWLNERFVAVYVITYPSFAIILDGTCVHVADR